MGVLNNDHGPMEGEKKEEEKKKSHHGTITAFISEMSHLYGRLSN
jgi:hypothetical protein